VVVDTSVRLGLAAGHDVLALATSTRGDPILGDCTGERPSPVATCEIQRSFEDASRASDEALVALDRLRQARRAI
jgi:hypothetical protein